MNKEELISKVCSFKKQIPEANKDQTTWLKYLQKLDYLLSDVQLITGPMNVVLRNLWNNFPETKRYSGTIPYGLSETVNHYYIVGKNLEQFFDVLEEWIEDGFKEGRFPIQKSISNDSVIKDKSLEDEVYAYDGKLMVLPNGSIFVNNKIIEAESTVGKREP